MDLGKAIKMRRAELGMRQTALVALVGANQKTISDIECGKIDPRFSLVVKIAAALGLTVGQLAEYAQWHHT